MEFADIDLFLTVTEHQSLRRAAEKCAAVAADVDQAHPSARGNLRHAAFRPDMAVAFN